MNIFHLRDKITFGNRPPLTFFDLNQKHTNIMVVKKTSGLFLLSNLINHCTCCTASALITIQNREINVYPVEIDLYIIPIVPTALVIR